MEEREVAGTLENMEEQPASLRKRYIRGYTLGNQGILQTASIYNGYLWFHEYLPSDGTEDWAWQELEHQIGLQVPDDGACWEQSVMYHMEVFLACMKLLASCRTWVRTKNRTEF